MYIDRKWRWDKTKKKKSVSIVMHTDGNIYRKLLKIVPQSLQIKVSLSSCEEMIVKSFFIYSKFVPLQTSHSKPFKEDLLVEFSDSMEWTKDVELLFPRNFDPLEEDE